MLEKAAMTAMQSRSWKKSDYILLALIVLLTGAAQIHLFRQGFYAISADESDRILKAVETPFSQILRPTYWLPLYVMINKTGLLLYNDLFITPRILTSIAGIITSLAAIFLAYRLFGNRIIALVTGILAIYAPHRLVFSVAPMAEIYFMCFMTLGCAFFLGWLARATKSDLYVSAFLFLLTSTLRYEGWLVCATMLCMLTVQCFMTRKLDRKTYALISIIVTAFPLYWILSAYCTNRMWTFSIYSKCYIDLYGKDTAAVWQRSFLHQVIEQAVYTPLIPGVISFLCHAMQDRQVRIWSLLLILPVLGMTALGFARYSLPTHNWWRVAGPTIFLLLPFLAHLLYTVATGIAANTRLQFISLSAITALFVLFFHAESATRTACSDFTTDDLYAGTFLNTLMHDDEGYILIDSGWWGYTHVMVASGMPDRFVKNTGPDPFYPKPGIVDFSRSIDTALLKKWGVKYLVFQTKGSRRMLDPRFLARISGQAAVLDKNKELRKLNQIGEWGIFALQ